MPHPDSITVKPGFFPESLEGLEERFCLVSLDVDFYQTTLDGLHYFWSRLEKGGYILRTEDKEDGRNHKVRLTEKGESILKSTRQRFDSVDRTMFEGISEQELQMFCDLVDRMGQNLAEKEKTHETMV
jgi:DNA-binding PadR family transcriptional regulator